MIWQEQTTITTTWSGGKVMTTVWSEENSSAGDPLYYSDGSPVLGRDGQQIRVKPT